MLCFRSSLRHVLSLVLISFVFFCFASREICVHLLACPPSRPLFIPPRSFARLPYMLYICTRFAKRRVGLQLYPAETIFLKRPISMRVFTLLSYDEVKATNRLLSVASCAFLVQLSLLHFVFAVNLAHLIIRPKTSSFMSRPRARVFSFPFISVSRVVFFFVVARELSPRFPGTVFVLFFFHLFLLSFFRVFQKRD